MTSNSAKETTGGILLLVATVIALIWSNLDFASYSAVRDLPLGAGSFQLSIGSWVSDGLLAIFFFLIGLELKNEWLQGALRDKKVAIVPISAAIGGMVFPALIFLAFNGGLPSANGWGIPMATDIAFTLAILAIVGRKLPIELRIFLLTLAVVDDLGAILVIAIFYTATIHLVALAAAVAGLALFWFLQRKNRLPWFVYLPLALFIWAALHESGIHATIAGVAMGLLMNLKNAHATEAVMQPISSWFAVPVFALFTAGVNFGLFDLEAALASPVSLGILLGLCFGKPLGIAATSWLVTKFSRAKLSHTLSWWDITAIGFLAGVGFTVSLLINELAFHANESTWSLGTLAVLVSSTLAALFGTVALLIRNRAHSR